MLMTRNVEMIAIMKYHLKTLLLTPSAVRNPAGVHLHVARVEAKLLEQHVNVSDGTVDNSCLWLFDKEILLWFTLLIKLND